MSVYSKVRFKVIGLPILILLVSILLFMYFVKTKSVQPPVEVKEKAWLVETMAVKFERLSPVQTLYGKVESFALVNVAAPVSGVVDKVWVREGDRVKSGVPLVSMSLEDLDIPLQQAKADVEDSDAQLALQVLANKANVQRLTHEQRVLVLKETKVERTRKLIQKDLASQADLDLVKEALEKQKYVVVGAQLAVEEAAVKIKQAKARLVKAKALLAQARLNRERGLVTAPYDARITKVAVSEGSRVATGAALVSFYGLDSLELRAKLPVTILESVQSAMDSGISLEAFYQLGAERISLPLSRLAGEAMTSGLDAFFTLPASLSHLRPGDLMEVRLQGEHFDRVMAVPYSALYGQNKVYLVQEGELRARSVQVLGDVLREGRLWALIRSDFNEGERISITHLPNAVTGLKVKEATE